MMRNAAKPIRRRDGPGTVARIRSAATTLLAQHGFDAVSIKQIAAHAQVTIGALYHHYPSKESIYADITHRAFIERSTLPPELRNSSAPPKVRLQRLIEWFIREIVMDERFGPLLHREMLDPRPSTPRLLDRDQFHSHFVLFQELIEQIAPGSDVDQAVATTLALIFGFSNLRGIHALFPRLRRAFESPADIAAHVTGLLITGLSPPSGRPPSRRQRR